MLETGDGVGNRAVGRALRDYRVRHRVPVWKVDRERALRLIDVAHPNCREELLVAAKSLGYVRPEQVLGLASRISRARGAYGRAQERRHGPDPTGPRL